jgi:hypothetical protein
LPDGEGFLRLDVESLWHKARELRGLRPRDLAIFQRVENVGRVVEDRQAEADEGARLDPVLVIFGERGLQVARDLDQLLAGEVAGAPALRVVGRAPLDVPDGVHQPE